MTNPADLSVPEAAAMLRAGTLTSRALTEAVLDRIATRNPTLHAFTHIATDALAQADRADALLAAGEDPGPLCGIPIAVKDLIDVAGQPATSGSRVHAGRTADSDAPTIARLRAQGAVLIGKVATYEFAMVGPDLTLPDPPARNPWNSAHITGGSSSGSAAAVAGGLVRLAVGTDTGGSIRSPSAYCGCVGLKPTYDRVSRAGAFPLSPSLDHTGPLAATVEEAALALDAMTEGEWRPASSRIGQPITGLKIAYARDWFANDPQASPALIKALDEAASALSLLGAQITLVALPDYAPYEAAASVILHAEALDEHRDLIRDHASLYGRPTLQCLAFGAAIDAEDVAKARKAQTRLTAEMLAAMDGHDLILTATTLTPALPFSAFDGEKAVWTPMRTIAFNLTGQPALSLPAGFENGLPLGLQLIARHGDEDLLCRTGHAFERATDHSVQRPPP
jgi:aspartyl-tRNA(Asn)/glutamyl-tRNA(Gln) amidotransferase subunit A